MLCPAVGLDMDRNQGIREFFLDRPFEAIADVIRMQEDVGLQSITDGEFRREYFHIDFLAQLSGVTTEIPRTFKVEGSDGKEHLAPPAAQFPGAPGSRAAAISTSALLVSPRRTPSP